jgi:hypothetical protein
MKRATSRSGVAVTFVFTVAGVAWAKVPKIPGTFNRVSIQSESASGAALAPQGAAPELLSVTPNSAPPGGSGDLVLTGKNFVQGVNLRIGCKDSQNVHIDSMKIESPERAVAHVTFPDDLPEGPCDFYLEFTRGTNNEILPSIEGTREVVQAKSVSFNVSNSSTAMGVGLGEYALIAQADLDAFATIDSAQANAQKMAADVQSGKVNPMDPEFMKKMQEAAMQMAKLAQQGQKSAQSQVIGELLVKASTVSFVQDGKTIFNEPVSKVKEVTLIHNPMDSSGKIFRIDFSDGKTYGLGADKSNTMDLAAFKKKLGK